MTTTQRQPVLFLSHGAPPLADDTTWTGQLQDWCAAFTRPKNILMVSAHWEQAPTTVSGFEKKNPLTYDFWGFPERYYTVEYDAPLAPELAMDVAKLVATPDNPIQHDPNRGLDHGAYVPLVELFPEADVPVLQMSLPTLDPHRLFELGRKLGQLRDQGTLIVGSGFTTHNLGWFDPSSPADAAPPTASAEFDHWAAEAVAAGDVDAILDFQHRALGSPVRRARRGRRHRGPHRQPHGRRRFLVRPEQALLAVQLTPAPPRTHKRSGSRDPLVLQHERMPGTRAPVGPGPTS